MNRKLYGKRNEAFVEKMKKMKKKKHGMNVEKKLSGNEWNAVISWLCDDCTQRTKNTINHQHPFRMDVGRVENVNGCLAFFFSSSSFCSKHKRNEVLRGISSKWKSQYGPKRKKENPSNINHWAHYSIILYVFFSSSSLSFKIFRGVRSRRMSNNFASFVSFIRSSSSIGIWHHTIIQHTTH